MANVVFIHISFGKASISRVSGRSTNEQLWSITFNAHTLANSMNLKLLFFHLMVKALVLVLRVFSQTFHTFCVSLFLWLSLPHTIQCFFFCSLFKAWSHEDRLFNVFAFYIASATFSIKYSFFPYIFVLKSGHRWWYLVSLLCASPCFISFKFIQSLTTYSNSNFQRGHENPYSLIHIYSVMTCYWIFYYLYWILRKKSLFRARERERIEKKISFILWVLCVYPFVTDNSGNKREWKSNERKKK